MPYTPQISDDAELVRRLRDHDEVAYELLLDRYQNSMLRVAQLFVRDVTAAEDVVQETWLALFEGLDRFESRSSFKTWMFSILVNRAKTRAQRDGRSIPLSMLDYESATQGSEPSVESERFFSEQYGDRAGHWSDPPSHWNELPEERLMSTETLDIIQNAINALAPVQRNVITLRDLLGMKNEEVCAILGITDANQRVLLHRARSAVRRALEKYFGESQ
jgi:RNA polymerase sigma-70 factor, ECF subfamily